MLKAIPWKHWPSLGEGHQQPESHNKKHHLFKTVGF